VPKQDGSGAERCLRLGGDRQTGSHLGIVAGFSGYYWYYLIDIFVAMTSLWRRAARH